MEDQRRCVKNRNRIYTVKEIYMSSLVRGRSGSNQTRLEWMIGRGGTVANSQRWYGELGTVELVAPGSAVVDEGGLPRLGYRGMVPDM